MWKCSDVIERHYQILDHFFSLRSEDSESIHNIQSSHISSKNSLDCVMNDAVCSSTSNSCTEQCEERCVKGNFFICSEPTMIWGMRWTCNALLLVLHQVTNCMFFSRSLEWLMCPLEHCGLANLDSEYEGQKVVALLTATTAANMKTTLGCVAKYINC